MYGPKQNLASPHGRNLRKGRHSLNGQIYVVTFVTRDRIPWFEDMAVARILVRAINGCDATKTLAFVVMPDHVHWLLQIINRKTLSEIVQAAKSGSAYRINRNAGRKGAFWQAGFHDHAVRNERALKDITRYIVANPLRAGLVRHIGDYPHWDARWL